MPAPVVYSLRYMAKMKLIWESDSDFEEFRSILKVREQAEARKVPHDIPMAMPKIWGGVRNWTWVHKEDSHPNTVTLGDHMILLLKQKGSVV